MPASFFGPYDRFILTFAGKARGVGGLKPVRRHCQPSNPHPRPLSQRERGVGLKCFYSGFSFSQRERGGVGLKCFYSGFSLSQRERGVGLKCFYSGFSLSQRERAGVRVRFLEWSTILQPPLNVLNTGLAGIAKVPRNSRYNMCHHSAICYLSVNPLAVTIGLVYGE